MQATITEKAPLLVLRFSAMGDVAMVASVLEELAAQHPELPIVMVSRPAFAPFFEAIPTLRFLSIDPKGRHKGLIGLFRLYRELRHYRPGTLADLHDNIRSRVLSLFFRLAAFMGAIIGRSSIKIRRIDKGRAEKKALTRSKNKILRALEPTVERYAKVLRQLGYSLTLSHRLCRKARPLRPELATLFSAPCAGYIGISPFAQHDPKRYALSKMTEVIDMLNKKDYRLFIFGGGASEKAQVAVWEKQFPGLINLIGQFSLREELDVMSHLDVMLSMDSSGMHMASLMGVPVVSVWGPTHPYAGFMGYGQAQEDAVQANHPDRPNSIYGNRPLLSNGQPVIDQIDPEDIVAAIERRKRNRKEN